MSVQGRETAVLRRYVQQGQFATPPGSLTDSGQRMECQRTPTREQSKASWMQDAKCPDFPTFCDICGEPDRIRTCDPLIKSQLLYQLSYRPHEAAA
jgi:hypothetical protein